RMRQSLGYTETLKRGYAVVRGDGRVVTTRKAASRASTLEIEFSDGRQPVVPGRAEAAPREKPIRRTQKGKDDPEQGSLF
ncbi:MAG TPA: exodeoxyribonuclease VII large subunit, partial [Aliiroseovarius sp.]|nr:exodeoxyribonuclease VII large subunit [Aliiroseovarius sp.]